MITLDCKEVFFTSDTHFFHKNIIEYCNRPFSNVEEMNEGIINLWNEVVPKDGIVFHLGDVCFGGKTRLEAVVPRLNGDIYLIRGNHDVKNIPPYLFKEVHDQLMIKVTGDEEIPEQKIFMHHFPFLTWPEKEQGCWQLFGHTHQNDLQDCSYLKTQSVGQLNVGLDNNNCKPFTFEDIKIRITKHYLGYAGGTVQESVD